MAIGSDQKCVVCGKSIFVEWWEYTSHKTCDQCKQKELANYQGKLGDTTGDSSRGEDCYSYDSDYWW